MNGRASAKSIDISSLEVAALVREISAQLGGNYLSNIYSAGDAQLLTFGRRDEEKTLVISPRLGSWLTKRLAQRSKTTMFTTSLRGELLRSKLDSVSQLDMDRVFLFVFSHGTNKKELVLELMPPGNIILLDDRRKTIVALRDVRSTQRKVSRGVVYSPPIQARLSPDQVDHETLKPILAKGASVGKALGKGISLPRRYIDEILRRSALRQDDPSPQNDEKVGEVAGAVRAIIAETADPHPCIVKMNDETHLMAIRPTTGEILREGATLSELLEEIVSSVVTEREAHEETPSKRREEEYRVTLSRLKVQLGQLEENSNRLRERANLIRRRTSTEEVMGDREEVREFIPPESLRRIERENSPAAIASILFDQAKINESEAVRVREASASVRKRMEREIKLEAKRRPSEPRESRKREWYEKFRWFFTSQDRLAVGGRDAHSNSILVKRHLERDDVVYHADLFGSPFFILKNGRGQTDEEVKEVAKSTVAFSSGWKTGLGSADAYWVNSDQVSAAAPSGEYLARGSFMIRGKKNFVSKNILQISVGVDHEWRVISGPEEAVMKHAVAYLTIIPSREKTSETAKKILAELRKAVGDKMTFDNTVDDVLRMLPSGGGKIVRGRATR